MSWQVVVFIGLGLVLAGGFWWYERSRPSARMVALVAALAALAVAGRLVLRDRGRPDPWGRWSDYA